MRDRFEHLDGGYLPLYGDEKVEIVSTYLFVQEGDQVKKEKILDHRRYLVWVIYKQEDPFVSIIRKNLLDLAFSDSNEMILPLTVRNKGYIKDTYPKLCDFVPDFGLSLYHQYLKYYGEILKLIKYQEVLTYDGKDKNPFKVV
jgi:hypothetical protein